MQDLLSPDQLEIANNVSEAVGHANLPTNRIAAVYVTGDPFESVGSSQAPNSSVRDLRLNVVSDSHVSSTSNLLPSLLPSPVLSEALPENIFAIVPNITSNTSPSAEVHFTRPTSSNFSGNFEELLNEASRRVLDAQSNNEQEQDEILRVVQSEPNIREEQNELEALEESSSSDESDERDSGERAYTRSRGRVDEDPNAVQKLIPRRQSTSNEKRKISRARDDVRSVPYSFKCGVCGKAYRQRNFLKTHLSSHVEDMRDGSQNLRGETTIKCSVCQKTFGNSGGLATHLRSHIDYTAKNTRSRVKSCLGR